MAWPQIGAKSKYVEPARTASSTIALPVPARQVQFCKTQSEAAGDKTVLQPE
ncbi:MAG: hypothetical protein QF785_04245 [Phycisphaeraceae bacterium]|jgi:hypothetical protein|nr:hypothetical protein [Phycisphaeraceae bacterium]MDP7348095.1 hypothetical protein [Phycisphaeraceae bacterium]